MAVLWAIKDTKTPGEEGERREKGGRREREKGEGEEGERRETKGGEEGERREGREEYETPTIITIILL